MDVAVGAAGGAVSTIQVPRLAAALSLPAVSVLVTLSGWLPSASALVVML
jgi:hypothetical protein